MLLIPVGLLVAAALLRRRESKKKVKMLFRGGELVNDYAVFPCGCRFPWTNPTLHRRICAGHQAIIDAEVSV